MIQENLQINIGANTQDLQTGLNQATASVNTFSTSVQRAVKPTGDATQSLTNLGRIAQDAPYGFIGIANNLNPMLESFQRLQKEAGGSVGALKAMAAGLSGPAGIGIALSVGSSLLLAFGKQIDEFYTKLQLGSTITLQYATALKGIGGDFTSAAEKVNKVEIAFAEYHNKVITGEQALKTYNDTLGKNLGVKSNINDAEETFVKKSNAYIEASFQRSLADAASKKAAEELLKVKILQATGGEKTGEFGKMIAAEVGKAVVGPLLPKAATDKLVNLYDEDKTKKSIADGFDYIKNYKQIAAEARTLADQLSKSGGINLDPEKAVKPTVGGNKASQARENVDTSYLETLRLKQRLYMDDEYMTKEYADIIVQEELKIALKKAKINGASADEILNIKEQASIKLEQNQIDLGNKLTKLYSAEDKKWLADQKEKNKKQEAEDDKAAKAKIEAEKEKQKQIEELQKQHEKFADVISQNVTGALFSMYDAMKKGEEPLKALGNFLQQIIEKLIEAVVQAAIFQGIMMLLNPTKAGEFGVGFIGKLGKILGFAEGGIVSQPTIAMVGEGGQSEAIMPLNKLGNMMNSTFNAGAMSGTGGGGGNGQFVLKGNDLVLALQRSNYSLNLRRGA
jgi:hypothetical protein